MVKFEQDYTDLDITLFILPPECHKYNGGVESFDRIFREDFYIRNNLFADTFGTFKTEQKSLF